MLDTPNRDRIAERREATRQEILSAAWAVAREQGLAQLTLREVADPGRHAGAFALHALRVEERDLRRDVRRRLDAVPRRGRGRRASCRRAPWRAAFLRESAHTFFDFAVADLARHQLMNQRTIPGFEPSPEAYAPAVQSLERFRARLARFGVTKEEDVDLCVP